MVRVRSDGSEDRGYNPPMGRSLTRGLAACALSAGIAAGLSPAVASADRSAPREHRSAADASPRRDHRSAVARTHRPVTNPVDGDVEGVQLNHLRHLTDDPKGRKQLFDLLRRSI